MSKAKAVVAIRRRIGSMNDGANVYLSVLTDELKEANFSVCLVVAPASSFGDRPIVTTSPKLTTLFDKIIWKNCLRVGSVAISLSPVVYWRFLRRLIREFTIIVQQKRVGPLPGRNSQRLPDHEAQALANLIDAESPDLAIVEYSSLVEVLNHTKKSNMVRAVLLHDLFSRRTEAMRKINRPTDVVEMTLEEEVAACEAADLLIYASCEERSLFEERLPGRVHRWLAPKRPLRLSKATGKGPRALFMGVRHDGNIDALEVLMTEIWPQVLLIKPDAKLDIVGEICSCLKPDWLAAPGVQALGVVNDLGPIVGPDVIGLAPARAASGVSIKIADYLSFGMPVIAFPSAVAGYGSQLNRIIDIPADSKSFANRLAELLNDPDQRNALSKKVCTAATTINGDCSFAQTVALLANEGGGRPDRKGC